MQGLENRSIGILWSTEHAGNSRS